MEYKKMENRIKQRIAKLQRELQMHQNRANQAHQILNSETTQIVAKQGAVLELQKLIDEKEEIEEKPKKEKIEKNKKIK